ncbi:MAG: prephenate dehydrogenase/arogenate dehydrogenase family protein, partial [Gemmatimonadetes bacterium]|nr:prephenate dehydrogenase/arogenate dehydrogenase family protein [Gemmatimonadota bacterium]NIU31649.1 prephenate dehydrogenase/arogenate dehydrogenase family protein [Gemmatimonadota bacterium]NIW64728.1 prephenate dehydrogenase/arogenate dehydrogenase family protein [Gemmatimonadota bacterium]
PGTSEDSPPGVAELRAELDRLDRRIVHLLARRLRLARRIGRRKREEGAPVLDPAQEAAVIRRAAMRARERGLAEEPVRRI